MYLWMYVCAIVCASTSVWMIDHGRTPFFKFHKAGNLHIPNFPHPAILFKCRSHNFRQTYALQIRNWVCSPPKFR